MPEPRKTEVLVIGAGPGGYVAAIRAAQLGKKVLVAEREKLGGVCLNVGCVPSKALIHAAKVVKTIRQAGAMGIEVSAPRVDVAKLQAWKAGITDSLSNGVAQLFRANKVEHLAGSAVLTGPSTARVAPKDGPAVDVEFEHAILATGSRPVEIPGFCFDGRFVVDSTAALDLASVPKDLVVIGGGFIGLEIGNAYQTLGSNVTVVEMMGQLLPGQDPDLVRVVERHLKKAGMKIHTRAKAKSAGSGEVAFELDGGKEERVHADVVLVSVGRRPNTDGLGLEAAGVALAEKGLVKVDRQLRTTNPRVFAIGDVVPGPALAHKASKEGMIAAAVIAGSAEEADWRALPWAVFTDPEIATVGLTEEQARAAGHDPVVGRFPFAASGRAKSTNEADGWVKVIADRKTDVLLGVHIVGPEASNLIAEAALAIEMGAVAEDLALTIHTHPTLPEALMEAAEAVHGRMIHAANR